jgi:ketosteroid isomerase-like protein
MDSRDEILATQQRFLQFFARNDLAGMASCYTEDAQMLVASMEPIVGRAAIQSVFKFTARPGHRLEFQTHELEVSGASALELGSYVRLRADGSAFDRGKYMVVWKLVGGEWKLHRDMFSTNLKATTLSAREREPSH